MKIFLAILTVLLMYIGITQFVSYLNAYDEIDISKKSTHVSKKEASIYRQKKLLVYGHSTQGDIDENNFSIDGYTVNFQCQGHGVGEQKNYNIERDSDITVKVYKEDKIIFETVIDIFKQPYLNSMYMDIAFDVFDHKLYLLYRTDAEQEKLFLLVADLKRNHIIFHKKIFQQQFGFFGMSVAYHEETNSLLIAYQVINAPSHAEELKYGIYNLTTRSFTQKPHSLFLYDGWEKSHPHFIRDKEKLYLLNTTGEIWGLLAYTGAPKTGISKIDSHGEPSEYFIMHDSDKILDPILEDNILTYSVIVELKDKRTIGQTKSIDIRTLYKLIN